MMSPHSNTKSPEESAPSVEEETNPVGSGVWRFALEGADDDMLAAPAERLVRGAEHASQVSLCVSLEGVLLSKPVGELSVLGASDAAEVGSSLPSFLDQGLATSLLERVQASIALHMQMHGVVETQFQGNTKRFQLALSPGHVRDVPARCVLTLRDVSNASGTSLADPFNSQSTVALASGIAHRFNNLLVAITGNAGLLKTCLPPDHPEQAAIQDMEQAARDMAAMTRYLLAFAGEGRYATRPVSINELAAQALAALNPALYPNVRLVESFDSELPPIEADPFQIEQAIYNLLMNAVEAMAASGGTLEVSTEKLPAESCVRVMVKDSGPGIAEPVRARIFEPFFTTKAPGRGLGLPAVLGIARGHRGSLRVRTALGTGTVVELYLPYSDRPPVSKRRRARTGERMLVLVVDDDTGSLRVLQRTLQSQGYAVLTAEDGESALKVFESRKAEISLCIVDSGLPDTSGDLLCVQLKKGMPNIPVIMCSGYADKRSEEQVSEFGADGFVAKPFTREELLTAIRRVVQGPGTER